MDGKMKFEDSAHIRRNHEKEIHENMTIKFYAQILTPY